MQKWIKNGFKYLWNDLKPFVYGALIVALVAAFIYFFPYLSFILILIGMAGMLLTGMGMALFLMIVPYFDQARAEERKEYRDACESKKDTVGNVFCQLLNRKLNCDSATCKFYSKGE